MTFDQTFSKSLGATPVVSCAMACGARKDFAFLRPRLKPAARQGDAPQVTPFVTFLTESFGVASRLRSNRRTAVNGASKFNPNSKQKMVGHYKFFSITKCLY